MARIRAIAESAPTSNPRRASTYNPRHPSSKLYTSPDGGSVRLTWLVVNSTWFLLWPGDAPVERQQVLGQFPQWEEGDAEARRIVEGNGAPAENPRDPGPPLDADYFERVARNFLHPLIMQHPDMQDSQKKVQELAGLLARTAERGRVGRAYR